MGLGSLVRRRRASTTVRLMPLGRAGLAALLDGDLDAASARARVTLPASFLEPKALWTRTLEAIEADRAQEPWAPRAIVAGEERLAVGHAGFLGAPDADGVVEIIVRVDLLHRGRGYARAAVAGLLRFAATDGEVTTVRARTAIDADAALAVLRAEGFLRVGDEWDDDEGHLVVHERSPIVVRRTS